MTVPSGAGTPPTVTVPLYNPGNGGNWAQATPVEDTVTVTKTRMAATASIKDRTLLLSDFILISDPTHPGHAPVCLLALPPGLATLYDHTPKHKLSGQP